MDGGKTFTNVLSMKSAMFGFAKSDDGKTYWAGSGLAEHGIWRSTDRGERWEKLAQHGVLCLHSSRGGLFVCDNPFVFGAPAIGLSKDEGKTVQAIASFADIEGPVVCADACAALWPATRASVVAAPDAGADAGAPASPERPASRCGCTIVGHDNADPRRTIAGLFALVAWAWARRVRGSKLTQVASSGPHSDP
jgi:hypothetical protein